MNTVEPKQKLHPRNKHINGYDLEILSEKYPKLKPFLFVNKYDTQTIDFSVPEAVLALNKALLLTYYNVTYWKIAKTNLCPPIPGRADYLHYIADLLAESNGNVIPNGPSIRGLDIGIGANCIYPIIGNSEYGWRFVGTEVDVPSLKNCAKIIEENDSLKDAVSVRIQNNKRNILKNIVSDNEYFDFVICNPPFHDSKETANKSSLRKNKNLGLATSENKIPLNFSGQNNELWCEGGEVAFITNLIYESVHFKKQVLWFTALVSKKENLKIFYNHLKKVNAITVKTVEMQQGNKTSRFVAWSFMEDEHKKDWASKRWQ